jgi:hypothetical protein
MAQIQHNSYKYDREYLRILDPLGGDEIFSHVCHKREQMLTRVREHLFVSFLAKQDCSDGLLYQIL